MKGSLRLLAASLAIVGSPGADLGGATRLELRVAPGSDAQCASDQLCRAVASYDRSRDGVAGRVLRLRAEDVDLVELTGQARQLVVKLVGEGTAPQPALWNAVLELDLEMKVRVSGP